MHELIGPSGIWGVLLWVFFCDEPCFLGADSADPGSLRSRRSGPWAPSDPTPVTSQATSNPQGHRRAVLVLRLLENTEPEGREESFGLGRFRFSKLSPGQAESGEGTEGGGWWTVADAVRGAAFGLSLRNSLADEDMALRKTCQLLAWHPGDGEKGGGRRRKFGSRRSLRALALQP